MAKIEVTLVFIPIIPDYIGEALKTLYEKTNIEFRVIVVDQTKDGVYDIVKEYTDLYIRSQRGNMGFSKANNEGMIHGMHWGSKYIVAANDDIVFLDDRWWQGIIDQFEAFPEMMAVCPASPVEPGWGYGIDQPNFKCPDWGVVVGENILPKAPDGSPITLEQSRTKKGYDMLLAHRQGHIEGFAGWFVVFKRETLEKIGLYDERFGPGGGEDYHFVHRIYLAGGRASATMRSFVWHHWSKSRKAVGQRADIIPYGRPTFADTNSLFIHAPDGATSPIFPPRDNEPFGNRRKLKSTGIYVDDIRL